MDDTTGQDSPPSGRFVLRLPPAFHKQLKRTAQAGGISLNDLCLRLLSGGVARETPLGGIVDRVVLESGDALAGLVIFGSYARGSEQATSDIDVLIVVDQPVTRSMYATWDAGSIRLNGHVVEPHYVSMPDRAGPITSLWAEVAMEGAVAYDPSLRISRYLTHVRHAILNGGLVRRVAQGKPYWTAA